LNLKLARHSSTYSVEVEVVWPYTYIYRTFFMAWFLIKHVGKKGKFIPVQAVETLRFARG
jgi:hypothetical protein